MKKTLIYIFLILLALPLLVSVLNYNALSNDPVLVQSITSNELDSTRSFQELPEGTEILNTSGLKRIINNAIKREIGTDAFNRLEVNPGSRFEDGSILSGGSKIYHGAAFELNNEFNNSGILDDYDFATQIEITGFYLFPSKGDTLQVDGLLRLAITMSDEFRDLVTLRTLYIRSTLLLPG